MKKKVILAFVLLTGLAWYMAISEAVDNPKRLAEHLEKAAVLEAQGIYVDAIEEYESALEYTTEPADINYRIALDYLELGEKKQFINMLKEIISAHPEKEEVLDSLMNYYQEHDKATAVKYIAGLVEQQPENSCAKGWLLELKGSYKLEKLRCEDVLDSYGEYFILSRLDEDAETETLYCELTDAMGSRVLPDTYESIIPMGEDGLAFVVKDGKALFVDEDGNTRKVPDMSVYSSVSMMNDERVVAYRDGAYGFLDDNLLEKTDFVYEELSVPAEKLAAAKQNGKWGLISRNGKAKTEFIYDDIVMDEHGIATRQKLAFVQENGSYLIIDNKGEAVGEERFEGARVFPENGYAAVCQNGKWGYVDCEGRIVVSCQFEDARSFQNGYGAVCENGKWGYIDPSGNTVIPCSFEQTTDITASGTAAVYDGEWKLLQLNLFR